MKVTEQYPFLAINADDSERAKAMKTELQLLIAMPLGERQVFLQQQRVAEEERELDAMVKDMADDDVLIKTARAQAKDAMWWHEQDGDESHLTRAEEYASLAHSIKLQRHTIKDIRKQREKIQWHKRKLNQMIKQLTEPSQYSSH